MLRIERDPIRHFFPAMHCCVSLGLGGFEYFQNVLTNLFTGRMLDGSPFKWASFLSRINYGLL